jgi:hypothetical protein
MLFDRTKDADCFALAQLLMCRSWNPSMSWVSRVCSKVSSTDERPDARTQASIDGCQSRYCGVADVWMDWMIGLKSDSLN